MTPQDLDQLNRLNLRQNRLETEMARLRADLNELEYRVKQPGPPVITPDRFVHLPPLPVQPSAPPQPATVRDQVLPTQTKPVLPPIPASVPTSPAPHFPPIPSEPASTSRSMPQAESAQPQQSPETFEIQLGRWLARIGVVFALITLISFSTLAYKDLYRYMGPWGKDAVLALISVALTWGGLRLERMNEKLVIFGRTLAAGGLASLYYTLYGATYLAPLQVITNPILGGLLLLAWSAYVLYLAEAKKSELLSIFAIALAYFSSAISPVGTFTLVANLILSTTAVIFLVRNAWTGLSYLCLVGTYFGFLRQVILLNGDTHQYSFIANVPFIPSIAYLTGAWLIYTAAVFLAKTPHFESGKRLAFLCLNNGAFLVLLLLTANITGFEHPGYLISVVGGIWIATGYLMKSVRADAKEVYQAYLIQGLGVGTLGLVVTYDGITRGLLLTLESLFLAASGAFSKNNIFRVGGCLIGLFSTLCLIIEQYHAEHPWVLIAVGAVAMLINAVLARRDLWKESCAPEERSLSLGATFYSMMTLFILWVGIRSQLSDSVSLVTLAVISVVLTFSVYLIRIYELPLLSQALLALVQVVSIYVTGDLGTTPIWQDGLIVFVTLLASAWWSFQRVVWADAVRQIVLILNALATVPLLYCLIHPHVSEQDWMICAGGLSLAYLLYGYLIRSWTFPVIGQILLAFSLYSFFYWINGVFNWAAWAAVIPIAVVFVTYWSVQEWLKRTRYVSATSEIRSLLEGVIPVYRGLTVVMILRSIFGLVPDAEVTACLFAIGTGYLIWNSVWVSSVGLRCALVFDIFGIIAYGAHWNEPGATAFHALGLALFLAQPFILKALGNNLLSDMERWGIVIGSVVIGWIFLSNEIHLAGSENLALGWVLYALGLIVLGFVASERKHRWCGLIVLITAIGRAGLFDFWTLSDLYKVLTFFVLSVTCLGLSYIYYRFADRIKAWL